MLWQVLEPHGHFFMLLLLLQPLSCYLPLVTSFAVFLWGRISVIMLWPSMTYPRTERCKVIVFPVVLFCSHFQWWVRTRGVFFGSEQKISEGCQMLAIFTYFWSFQVNETKRQKTLGGCLSAVRSQVVCRRYWSWLVSSTTGLECRGADHLTLTSLNKEDYLNGKLYY